jgi:hypothetical protein
MLQCWLEEEVQVGLELQQKHSCVSEVYDSFQLSPQTTIRCFGLMLLWPIQFSKGNKILLIVLPYIVRLHHGGPLMLFFLRDSKHMSQIAIYGDSSSKGTCHAMPIFDSNILSKLL